ncbi:ion transporter [Desulfotalea psychrophila]|nr:ion transporter [Desulfotalea psychrophila]
MKRLKYSTKFFKDISLHTPFVKMLALLIILWLIFSAALYFSESNVEGSSIHTYGDALYWGIAAFSTAGIADSPTSNTAQFVGGLWIVIGSMLFFGTIVATITTYFMRPMQRPHRRIIDAIEYNLEQLDDLTVEELSLLKNTVDALIMHVERMRKKQDDEQQAE